MCRFEALLQRACIDVADLPPNPEVNGLMVYLGTFPNGCGRIFLNPDIAGEDDPRYVAVVAHELSHFLLSTLTDHPGTVLPPVDSKQRPMYERYEDEANQLAAYLLVPPAVRSAYAAQYATPEAMARALGVPTIVVERALARPDYDPRPICEYLSDLIGHPHFVPRLEGQTG